MSQEFAWQVTFPQPAYDAIQRLMGAAGIDDPSVLFGRMFGLLKIAVDAHREGNRVAIVGPDDEIVQELTGIVG